MIKKTILLTLFLLALIGCTQAPTSNAVLDAQPFEFAHDATYTLDSDLSTLTYGAYRLTGRGHVGNVTIRSGELVRKNGEFTSGSFVIDMTTITESNNNERFLGHVRNEDFFDVENYPESVLVVNSIKENENGSYTVTADLTIMDETNTVEFVAYTSVQGEDLRVTSDFTIDRTRWGITYDSGSFFSDLGDRAIKDEVDFSLDLVFT